MSVLLVYQDQLNLIRYIKLTYEFEKNISHRELKYRYGH
jgi:hypothetical protein